MPNIRTKEYAGHGEWTCVCDNCGEEFSSKRRSLHICKKPYYIYLIQAEILRYVKIGISQNVEKRLDTLQTGSPDKLSIVKTMRIGGLGEAQFKENALHQQFANYRLHKEWFKPEVLDMINALES